MQEIQKNFFTKPMYIFYVKTVTFNVPFLISKEQA